MPEQGQLLAALEGAFRMLQQPSMPARVWQDLRPWIGRLVVNASEKWLLRIALGLPCQVPVYEGGVAVSPCPGHAVAACDVCGRTCCLNHARVDQHGDAICYLCVVDAVRRARGEAQSSGQKTADDISRDAERLAALMELGCKPSATWEQIHAAHKKLSFDHHPDRQRTDRQKAKSAERFRSVQAAFKVLEKQREQDVARERAA